MNQSQNKSQENKFMSTGRPNITYRSTQNKTGKCISNYASTQWNRQTWSARRIFQNISTQPRRSYQRSTPWEETVWVGRHSHKNASTHINGNTWARRHYYPNRSTHNVYRSTQQSHRSTHLQKSLEDRHIRSVMRTKYYQNRIYQKNNSHKLIYNKHQMKNLINKSICVKQIWILKCLLSVLETMNNLNGTKQI